MTLWRYPTLALRVLDPEAAHRATINGLKLGLHPRKRADLYPSLATTVAGLSFPNPLGLAAGFDKNAEAADPLLRLGFGFVEVGAVTPKPQPGNPKPRVFRLQQAGAVINRYGFNNDGLAAIASRLDKRAARDGIVGINLGANKDAEDRVADFVTGLTALEACVSFCTVNVSSPNTPGLRTLQDPASLKALLRRVQAARRTATPIFLKVAPDLTDEDKADIAAVARAVKLEGLIVSNTTLDRPEGLGPHAKEAGGLSGKPLFAPSTAVLKDFAAALGGDVPLIGVGGIWNADDAYAKILAGASLVQLYTALVYKGPDLITDILDGLMERLTVDGFACVADAVGQGS